MSAPDLLNITRPPAWMADALCAEVDPDLWFPEKGESNRETKRLCGRCPVRAQCLSYALANDEHHGVWAGTSERERRRLKRGATRRAASLDGRTGMVRQLATRLTDPEIAARLGCSSRTVLRIRTAAGIPPAQPHRGSPRVGAA